MAESSNAKQPAPSGDKPTEMSPRWRLATSLFLASAGVLLLVVFFDTLTLVLLLFLAAASLAALLRPLACWIDPKRPGRAGLAVGLSFWIVVVIALATLGLLLHEPIAQQINRLPEHQDQLNDVIADVADEFGLAQPPTVGGILTGVGNWLIGRGGDGTILGELADRVGVLLVALILLVFGSTFMLTETGGRIPQGLARLLPEKYHTPFFGTLENIETRLRWWLLGMMCSMIVVGTAAYIGFAIVGLEMALPLAMMAGFAELVPVIGPTFAFLLAALFGAAEGMPQFLGVLVVWAVIQVLEPYVLVPLVMRRAVHIPPLVSLFTVVFWAHLLGPLGLLLAIPINVVIWTILEQFVIEQRQREPGPTPDGPRGVCDS